MDKKLCIVEVIGKFLPNISGAIRTVDNYTKNLNGNHEVTVLTKGEKQDIYNYLPYPVVYCKTALEIKNKLKTLKADIIHVHSSGKIMDICIDFAVKNHIPLVATIHSDEIAKISMKYGDGFVAKLKIKKLIDKYNKLTEVFVFSPYVAERLRTYGFIGKVSYLPLASDLDSDKKKSELIKLANEEFKINPRERVLISIGNLRETKRLTFAITALYKAKKNGFDNFKYFIVGRGEELEKLELQVKKLKLTKEVSFLGFVPDEKLVSLIARADLLLLPTTYDLFGLSKIECAGFGTPGLFIIDSFVANEVFNDVNGYLSQNDVEKYAIRIQEIFADEKKLKEVSATAYTDLYITWETASKMLLDRLLGVINENISLSRKLSKNKNK